MPAPIQYPVQRPPQGRAFWWSPENITAGVAGSPFSTPASKLFKESITNWDTADQRDIFTADEVTGTMADAIGMDELSHYEQGTLTGPTRLHGLTGWVLADLLGTQYYVPTGSSGAYIHNLALQPFTNRVNTYTTWWQASTDPLNTANMVSQYLRCTPVSITLTFGAGGALTADASVWCQWPTVGTPPPAGFNAVGVVGPGATANTVPLQTGQGSQFGTGGLVTFSGGMQGTATVTGDTLSFATPLAQAPVQGMSVVLDGTSNCIYIGSDTTYSITREMGWGGTFTIRPSGGGSGQYTPRVISGTLTLSRPAEAVFASDGQSIIDIALGALTVSGTMVFQFDGYAAGTVARDFRDFKQTGSATYQNKIRYTDADGHYFELASHYWKWNPFTLDYSGQYVKGNGTFTAYNNPAMVMASNPALSVANLTMVNNISTAMINP